MYTFGSDSQVCGVGFQFLQAFGYTPDFIQSMKLVMKDVKARGIKVIANAGGVNLEACVETLRKTAQEQGVDLSIAMVAGDDMMDRVSIMSHSCST